MLKIHIKVIHNLILTGAENVLHFLLKSLRRKTRFSARSAALRRAGLASGILLGAKHFLLQVIYRFKNERQTVTTMYNRTPCSSTGIWRLFLVFPDP
jgi:hypothetical protein